MGMYNSCKISELIGWIQSGKLVLPAMQRNFVWKEEKICHLFDSLLRKYPVGTFLFWEIDDSEIEELAFNKFIDCIDEQKTLNRGLRVTQDQHKKAEYFAVLDGQQRITALNVGITGHIRKHLKGRKWDDDSSYEKLYLCIDSLVWPNEKDEQDNESPKYTFQFVKEEDIEKLIEDEDKKQHYWTKLSTVFAEDFEGADYLDTVEDKVEVLTTNKTLRILSRKTLNNLHNILRGNDTMSYYLEKDNNLARVVDIFVRVNSGGQKLSASDLMLSVASASQGDADIHQKMLNAIKQINSAPEDEDKGFKADKELILTAGLMFTHAESLSLSKKENYSRKQIDEIFIKKWDAIIDALCATTRYIEHIGFNGSKLTSKNLILPIAYYFFKNKLSDTHKDSSSNRAMCDRIFIRQWILRAIINDVFMDGTGSTLRQIRNYLEKTNKKYFPLDELMEAKIKQPLYVTNNHIEEILQLKYGDVKVVPLLMELTQDFPHKFQVDHIWPKSLLQSQKTIRKIIPSASEEIVKSFTYYKDNLCNLQLLNSTVNQEKQNIPFDEWIEKMPAVSKAKYLKDNCIPINMSYEFENFISFVKKREKLLHKRIKEAFPDSFDKLVNRFSLKNSLNG